MKYITSINKMKKLETCLFNFSKYNKYKYAENLS